MAENAKISEKREPEPTPLELANSWLDHRDLVVTKELESAETSLRFNENYKPKPPHRPGNIEYGSLDYSDWEAEDAEYNQWPEEQEQSISFWEGEMGKLEEELNTINESREEINDENVGLMNELAGKERERREKIEIKRKETGESERIAKEKSDGREMNGVSEAESVLKRIISIGANVSEDEKGKNSWELGRAWDDKHIYNKNNHQVDVTLNFSPEKGVAVRIDTFLEPVTPYEKRAKGQVDVGVKVSFTLKDGKIYNWDKGRPQRSYQWGYPELWGGTFGEDFEQSDLDNARKVLSELYSDLESLASK